VGVGVNGSTVILSHEKLDVYQVAVQFLAWSAQILKSFPRGHSSLSDQLRRAALSIPLNIAEGAGKVSRPDCSRFFAIARGSTLECAAIVDACTILNLVDPQEARKGKDLLVRAASMLSKLSRPE
jgi:four helix bundle protein